MQMVNGIGTILYGHARPEPVPAEQRRELEAAGYLPYSYLAVKWFVFVFLPILPLGTYRVIQGPGTWATGTQYIMNPAPRHWGQIALHYTVGWGLVGAICLAVRFFGP